MDMNLNALFIFFYLTFDILSGPFQLFPFMPKLICPLKTAACFWNKSFLFPSGCFKKRQPLGFFLNKMCFVIGTPPLFFFQVPFNVFCLLLLHIFKAGLALGLEGQLKLIMSYLCSTVEDLRMYFLKCYQNRLNHPIVSIFC